MSRSRKKNMYCSITCCGDRPGVEKAYKQQAHRQLRRAVKMILRNEESLLEMECGLKPHDRQYGDPWWGPKDGKWRADPKYCRK